MRSSISYNPTNNFIQSNQRKPDMNTTANQVYTPVLLSTLRLTELVKTQPDSVWSESVQTLAIKLGLSHRYVFQKLIPFAVELGLIQKVQAAKYQRVSLHWKKDFVPPMVLLYK